MKALVYNGPRDVRIKKVPDPKIENPTDVLVKITSTNICGSDLHMYEGKLAFDFGSFFEKGLHMGSGQCNVKAYNRYLCELINKGHARPSWIVSHELSLEEAPDAYKHFDARENGWTKVILHPAGGPGREQRAREVKKVIRPKEQFAHAE